jgi:hemerythrin-like domain-containing protein
MLRDKSLIPLSHQHQHALALCVRLQRGLQSGSADCAPWQAEVARLFDSEIGFHFEAEEQILFPAARQNAAMAQLVDELVADHASLRKYAARAQQLGRNELLDFASELSAHVRKEERQLFEDCQRLLPAEMLQQVGRRIEEYFRTSGMPGASCGLG